MEDQSKFLETLEDIKEIARAQGNDMTKQEVQTYFSDMQLSEDQWKAVYQYLGGSGIRVQGYDYIPEPEAAAGMPGDGQNAGTIKRKVTKTDRAARNRRIYQMELQRLSSDRLEPPVELMERFLQGEHELRDSIIESRLHQVMEIAGRYGKRCVPVEEVIAEGNLGLLYGMEQIRENAGLYLSEDGSVNAALFLETLEKAVIQAIETMIDAEMETQDQENVMLARANLLHEAAKYLTEENARVPTLEELSEYTRIPKEEIRQIMGLSEDAKRIASPEV